MNARAQVVEMLRDLVPESWVVNEYAEAPENPSAVTVLVQQRGIERSPLVSAWRFTFSLVVLTPLTTPGPADLDLDDAVIQVLFAIEDSPRGVLWTSAERGVTAEQSFPCYEVALTVDFVDPQPNNENEEP